MPCTVRDLGDPEALAALKSLTGGRVATPTIVVDGRLFMGFAGNEDALRAALGLGARASARTTDSVARPSGPVYTVLDPVGEQVVEAEVAAPRLADLRGAAVGYIDNGKWNVEPLLREVHALLRERAGAGEAIYRRKPLFSQPAPEDVYQDLQDQARAVLIAIGD